MTIVLSWSKSTLYMDPSSELVRVSMGGGVGDLRDFFDERFFPLRMRMPAQERFFFCFLDGLRSCAVCWVRVDVSASSVSWSEGVACALAVEDEALDAVLSASWLLQTFPRLKFKAIEAEAESGRLVFSLLSLWGPKDFHFMANWAPAVFGLAVVSLLLWRGELAPLLCPEPERSEKIWLGRTVDTLLSEDIVERGRQDTGATSEAVVVEAVVIDSSLWGRLVGDTCCCCCCCSARCGEV